MAEPTPTPAPVEHIGTRIRYWRRRRNGMTQTALAGLAGLSQSYISQIESGQSPLDRKNTQVAIAGALNISVAQLLGQPGEPVDPAKDRALMHVPALRAAIIELGAGETRKPRRDVDAVRAAVREVTELRNAADYASVAPMLPGVLYDLGARNGAVGPEMVETLFCTRYALKTMGYPDLAREAAEIGVRIADDHGDPGWRGQAVYSWVQSFPPESADLGARITSKAANELQGVPDRGAQEVYGCLHILSGFEAAVASRRDDAWAHIDEAADLARSLGEPERYSELVAGINGNWFGPTQVEVWRVAIAAELGDTAAAQVVAGRIDLDALPVPNRWVYFHTDMARTLAAGNRDREAMYALAKAERAAPLHFRFNPVVRNLVYSLIERAKRRAVADEFVRLAQSLGVMF